MAEKYSRDREEEGWAGAIERENDGGNDGIEELGVRRKG